MRAKHPGFTLIELVVSVAIVAVIGVVFTQIFSGGLKNYLVGREIVDDDAQARLALERLSRDIRMVRSTADISTFLPDRFVFVDSTGVSVDFQYSAATQQLTRAQAGGTAQPLADLVQGLNFTYQQTDGVSTASVVSAIQFVSVYLTVGSANSTLEYRTTVEPLGF
jgi:prepilin-type N-terminal cleavage/methylation domain-containing protein